MRPQQLNLSLTIFLLCQLRPITSAVTLHQSHKAAAAEWLRRPMAMARVQARMAVTITGNESSQSRTPTPINEKSFDNLNTKVLYKRVTKFRKLALEVQFAIVSIIS